MDSDWICNSQKPALCPFTGGGPLTPLTVGDDDRQRIAQAWLSICAKQNLDPTDNVNDMQLLAQLLRTTCAHVNTLFEGLKYSMRPWPGACCEDADDMRGITEPASTRQDRKTMFVTRYALDPTMKTFKAHGKGGKFWCTWGCPFSSPRRYEWERHEECHRPQKFWICDQCFSPTKDPVVFHRLDKLRSHLRSKTGCKNKSSDRLSTIEKRSEVHYSNPCEATCWYIRPGDNHACGHAFSSWKERLQHWTIHFANESRDNDPINAIGGIEDADQDGDAGASGGSSSESSFAGNGSGLGSSNAYDFGSSDDGYFNFGSFGNWSYQRSRSTSASSLSEPFRAVSAAEFASDTRNNLAAGDVRWKRTSINSAKTSGIPDMGNLTSDVAVQEASNQPTSTSMPNECGRKSQDRCSSEYIRPDISKSERLETECLAPQPQTALSEQVSPSQPMTYAQALKSSRLSSASPTGVHDTQAMKTRTHQLASVVDFRPERRNVDKTAGRGDSRNDLTALDVPSAESESVTRNAAEQNAALATNPATEKAHRVTGQTTFLCPTFLYTQPMAEDTWLPHESGSRPRLPWTPLPPSRPRAAQPLQPRDTDSYRATYGPERLKEPYHSPNPNPAFYCRVPGCEQQFSISAELAHHSRNRHLDVVGVVGDHPPICGIGAASPSLQASMVSRSRKSRGHEYRRHERDRTADTGRRTLFAPPPRNYSLEPAVSQFVECDSFTHV